MRFIAPFFPQSFHSGPIRDVLGPFCFISLFHRVIVIIKRLPSAKGTRESPTGGIVA